ncbi:YdeI/OmpD-associated family protein [Rosettibacter firmus]|uniref:YdeI/OmpD-associated family protein n=1 Tax=Rosettibacter firmus TaxID=3111522 RepID=UPI00336C2323
MKKLIEDYIADFPEWKTVLYKLLSITKKLLMKPVIKWGIPVFVYENKNIAGFAVFKNYAAIWFYQGALLKDNYKKLVNAQEGKTRALRQLRFSSPEDFKENEKILIEYLKESIENQKKGNVIKPAKKELIIPQELKSALQKDLELKDAFEKLSFSCKREYSEYVAEAKKEETRLKRLQKIIPMILERKGLNDKYRK